jgi:hypothetical protein
MVVRRQQFKSAVAGGPLGEVSSAIRFDIGSEDAVNIYTHLSCDKLATAQKVQKTCSAYLIKLQF